uniref:Transporter n=1 Tax=Steinernema glaseri TaxID=37863 RepID=A0A1I7ZS81_9BILA
MRSGGSSSIGEDDWRVALRQQIEQLARRNENHKKASFLRGRTEEVDEMIVQLRNLVSSQRESEAALLHLRCMSFCDESDKIVASRLSVASTRSTTPCVSVTSGHKVSPIDSAYAQKAMWGSHPPHPLFDVPEEEEEKYGGGYYGYSRKWWNLFCLNSGKEVKERDHGGNVRDLWNTQIEFFLSCLGFIVGVGNTLRFPSMAYQHGGGVFFIPYFVCLVFFGLPIVFMHLCIGQYSGLSASGAFWKMMPFSSGIGWALVLLAVPVVIYYNIIVAWTIYYFWYSIRGFFTDGLPWNHCTDGNPSRGLCFLLPPSSLDWITHHNCCELLGPIDCFSNPASMTSVEAFFHYQLLNRTAVDDPSLGPIQSHLFLALAVAWILVFFGVFKGIGSIGWAVSITATVPYLLLVILLLRGISLKGADKGLHYLFSPDISRLWDISMWKSAAEQVFYELGIDAGPLISMASFSRYRNNIYRDAVLLVVIDTFTSILCGMVIFSFIGFLATEQGKNVDEILKHDSLYLAYSVYPGVTSYMDLGPLWAALFFAMLMISALDAEFAWLEMIASAIMNQFGVRDKKVETRLLVGMCIVFFFCGVPLCARGGIYIFHSIENLNANWNSFSLSLMQMVVVCFVYGVDNFLEDIGEMLRVPAKLDPAELRVDHPGYTFWRRLRHFCGPTGLYIKWCWCFCAPAVLLGLLVASVWSYRRVTFNNVVLPWYYELIAWVSMTGPLLVVPITALYTLYEARRRRKPLRSVFSVAGWRNKKTEEEEKEQPKHTPSSEHDYMYIDPLSRGPSAKSAAALDPAVVAVASAPASPTGDDSYERVTGRIREWAEQNALDDIEHLSYSGYDEDGKTKKEEEANHRLKPQRFSVHSLSSVTGGTEMTLFGPPPAQNHFELSVSSTIKHRAAKRSDQRKNRMFDSLSPFNLATFSFGEEAKSAPVSSGSPSPQAAASPPARHRTRSSDSFADEKSLGSISITPLDMPRGRSISFLKPPTTKPRLKRPKPIDAPKSSSSDGGESDGEQRSKKL